LGYPMRGFDLEEEVARLLGERGWREGAAGSPRAVVVAWAW